MFVFVFVWAFVCCVAVFMGMTERKSGLLPVFLRVFGLIDFGFWILALFIFHFFHNLLLRNRMYTLQIILILIVCIHCESLVFGLSHLIRSRSTKMSSTAGNEADLSVSNRLRDTEHPYIEDILDHYAYLSDKLINLALGSSYWNPPDSAVSAVQGDVFARVNHRYGNILGMPELRQGLLKQLQHASKGKLDVESVDIAITSGANQAFANVALALCDAQDHAIILAPYYFSHLLSLQLAQAQVTVSAFDKATLKPNWQELETCFAQLKPKVVSMLCLHRCACPQFYLHVYLIGCVDKS